MSLPAATVKVKTRKLDLSSGLDETFEEDVAVESPIEIMFDGKIIVTLLATPSQIEDLAVGFLLDEGIIDSGNDLVSVRSSGKTVDVQVKDYAAHYQDSRNRGLVLTSCGSYNSSTQEFQWPSIRSDYKVDAKDISQMILQLSRSSVKFAKTGATHSAAIFHEKVMKAFAEDVGRHNAIDKVIGSSMRQGLDLTQAVLTTTGRQPSDLILKAARVGVPISVSMRGPIHSGVLAAEKTGLTLVCFARGLRMNVYTFPQRIVY